jgi:methionine-rich copper-binding protein CopC
MYRLAIRQACRSAAVWALLAVSYAVHAEGVLVKSVPDENAELIAFDGRISLTFSGNVGIVSTAATWRW